jgi:hypothetical protein
VEEIDALPEHARLVVALDAEPLAQVHRPDASFECAQIFVVNLGHGVAANYPGFAAAAK